MEHGTYDIPPPGWDLAGSEAIPENGAEAWEPPPVLTARQLYEEDVPSWEPILAAKDGQRGPFMVPGWRIVIGGESGAGKTTMSLRLVRAVALGEDFLEWKALRPGRVLILDLEQGLRTVRRRLEETGLEDCDMIDYVRIPDGLALEKAGNGQAEWLEGVLAAGRYQVVLIDPLYKLHQGDANDERAIVDLMRMLDRWREDLDFCLIIPAHLRKADKTGRSKPSMDDVAGNASIVRGAEVVVGIQLLAGLPEGGDGVGKSRLHFWKDRDGDLPVGSHWDLSFTPDRGYWRDEIVKVTGTDKVQARLAAVTPEWMTASQLAADLDITTRTVMRNIAAVRDRGIDVEEQEMKVSGRKPVRMFRISPDAVVDADDWEEKARG